jgi:hypothetical protein
MLYNLCWIATTLRSSPETGLDTPQNPGIPSFSWASMTVAVIFSDAILDSLTMFKACIRETKIVGYNEVAAGSCGNTVKLPQTSK